MKTGGREILKGNLNKEPTFARADTRNKFYLGGGHSGLHC
jgi:hypothetical protein